MTTSVLDPLATFSASRTTVMMLLTPSRSRVFNPFAVRVPVVGRAAPIAVASGPTALPLFFHVFTAPAVASTVDASAASYQRYGFILATVQVAAEALTVIAMFSVWPLVVITAAMPALDADKPTTGCAPLPAIARLLSFGVTLVTVSPADRPVMAAINEPAPAPGTRCEVIPLLLDPDSFGISKTCRI